MVDSQPQAGIPRPLNIYVIYNSPLDFPGQIVVRRWEYDTPKEAHTHPTIEAARTSLPPGLFRLGPGHGDAQSIVEYWI